MEAFASDSITELYCRLCEAVYGRGWDVGSTKERENIVTVLYDVMSRLVLEPSRKHKLDYLKKELLWYLSGSLSANWIGRYAKIWLEVADKECHVNSNYGHALFHRDFAGKTQFGHVVSELQRDACSRRAIMFFQLPELHYCQMHTTKDYPCTCTAQFLLRQRELNMTVYMRSNDLIYGWCNDIPFFSFVLELAAAKLGVRPGRLVHHAGSLHVYDRHFSMAKEAVLGKHKEWRPSDEQPFPRIKREEVDKILHLQPCSFVDFLTDGGEIDVSEIKGC